MTNKGQALVLVVALLPLLFILLAFIFDVSLMIRESNRLNNIARSSIEYLVMDNKDIEEVKTFIIKSDSDIKIINITYSNVALEKNVKSVFGKIIGFDKYTVKKDITGEIVNGKLIIDEKGN